MQKIPTIELQGIIISTRFRIEKALKERKAFNEKTAADAQEANVNFQGVLDLMERDGLIVKTSEGRIFMTPKGQEKQIRGFTVHNRLPAVKKFVRFSRNK